MPPTDLPRPPNEYPGGASLFRVGRGSRHLPRFSACRWCAAVHELPGGLSQPRAIRDVFLWTGLLTVGSLLLIRLIPQEQRMIEALLVGLQVFVMYFLATRRLQGRAIALHVQQGGELASYWSAIAIGIVCGIVLLWVLVGLGLGRRPRSWCGGGGATGIPVGRVLVMAQKTAKPKRPASASSIDSG